MISTALWKKRSQASYNVHISCSHFCSLSPLPVEFEKGWFLKYSPLFHNYFHQKDHWKYAVFHIHNRVLVLWAMRLETHCFLALSPWTTLSFFRTVSIHSFRSVRFCWLHYSIHWGIHLRAANCPVSGPKSFPLLICLFLDALVSYLPIFDIWSGLVKTQEWARSSGAAI